MKMINIILSLYRLIIHKMGCGGFVIVLRENEREFDPFIYSLLNNIDWWLYSLAIGLLFALIRITILDWLI